MYTGYIKNSYINKNTNNTFKKFTKDLNRHFSKEDIPVVNKIHEKKLSIIIRKI